MKKRQFLSLLLSIILCSFVFSIGAFAASRPVNAVNLTANGSAISASGWYRFTPNEDALFCFRADSNDYTITVYQSKIAPSEFSDTEREIVRAEQELSDARNQLADGQRQYDDAVAMLEDNRDTYNFGVKYLEDNKQKYEDYLVQLQDPSKATYEAEEFVVYYEDAQRKLKQYEDGERQVAEAKVQLEEAAAQIADGENDLNTLKNLLAASRRGQSGDLWECGSTENEASYWIMAKGSEYFIRLDSRVHTLHCDQICSVFQDIPTDVYYFDPVYWAAANEITRGTSEGLFSPDMPCTRAHVVTFLWRAAGEPENHTLNHYEDVNPSEYYYKAVLWATEHAITYGTDATHFSPDEPCTRGQIVTFLWRFFECPQLSGRTAFADVPLNEYYSMPVHWAVNNEITYGTDAAHFSPDEPCTRAQVVTFLYRAA